MKKITYVLLSAALAATLLTGCGNKDTAVDTAEPVSADASADAASADAVEDEPVVDEALEQEPMTILGILTEGEDAYQIPIENATGKDIKAFAVQKTGDEDFSDNLIGEDDVYVKDEVRLLALDASVAEGDDADTEVSFEIKITTEDDTEYVLTEVPYQNVDSLVLHIDEEEDLAYFEYHATDAEEGVMETTLEAEKAKKDAEVQVEAAPAETAPVQTAPAQTETYTQPVETAPTQEVAPVETPAEVAPVETPAVDSGAAGEGCVDDGLTY